MENNVKEIPMHRFWVQEINKKFKRKGANHVTVSYFMHSYLLYCMNKHPNELFPHLRTRKMFTNGINSILECGLEDEIESLLALKTPMENIVEFVNQQSRLKNGK